MTRDEVEASVPKGSLDYFCLNEADKKASEPLMELMIDEGTGQNMLEL